jgi:hypothetical protein
MNAKTVKIPFEPRLLLLMEKLNLKPTHKPVQNYYEAIRQFSEIGVSHEGAVRSAFQTLLEHCGRSSELDRRSSGLDRRSSPKLVSWIVPTSHGVSK